MITEYKLKKTEDGDIIPVAIDVVCLTGYFIADPNELRRVFRAQQSVKLKRFLSLDRQRHYAFQFDRDGFLVNVGALEIGKTERDRIEVEHNYKINNGPITKTHIRPTSVGRPSVMKRITKRFNERAAMGAVEPTLQAEARVLRAWAENEWRDIPAPALKTIANNLRPRFQTLRTSTRHA